jgi:hypothetical protein
MTLFLLLIFVFFDVRASLAQLPAGLAGPRYYANMQLKDGDASLPKGGADAYTLKMFVDTAAPGTTIPRADAKKFGLLKADDTDNGFQEPTEKIGDKPPGEIDYSGAQGANGIRALFSKKLSVLAKGLKADMTDNDKDFKKVDGLRVVYPKKGEPDLPAALLGSNFIDGAGKSQQLKGDQSFFAFTLPADRNKTIDLVEEPVSSFDPVFPRRRMIDQIKLDGVGPESFYVATGSPFTIISPSLALSLGLTPTGTYDLFHEQPDVFGTLFLDGFFGDSDPGPFDIVTINTFAIKTEGDMDFVFNNVPVLVNRFVTNQNVFGTNLLSSDDLLTVIDYSNNRLQYEVVPEPMTITILGMVIPIIIGFVFRRYQSPADGSGSSARGLVFSAKWTSKRKWDRAK